MTATMFPYTPYGVGNPVGKRITDLPAAPSVNPTDIVPIVHDGQTMKAQAAQFILAALTALSTQRTITDALNADVLVSDYRVLINLTVPGPVTVTLPNAADVLAAGYNYLPKIIKDLRGDAGTNNITFAVDGGGTIDTTGIFGDGASVALWPLSDGSGWWVQY